MWQGKLIGAVIGYLVGRLPGAVIGAFMGHLFDVERQQRRRDPRSIQQGFFRATFQVMGHVAKADGRVSEQEIQAARQVMAQFRLGEAEVRQAIELFTAGKQSGFALHQCLQEFAQLSANRLDVRLMFVQIQLQTALLGGGLNPHARSVLLRICDALRISPLQFAQMEAMLRMQAQGFGGYNGGAGTGGPRAAPRADALQGAYGVLGVNSSASDAEVTKAYRRLMNQNHPDKLVAKGLPESMMKMAEEKTRTIRQAYELICEARGIK